MRGGYGLFYDRMALRPLANALLSAGNTTNVSQVQLVSTSLNFGQTGAPVFPNILLGASCRRALQLFHDGPQHTERLLRTGKLGDRAANGQARHNSASTTSICAALRLIVSVNLNMPTCTSAVDPVNCAARILPIGTTTSILRGRRRNMRASRFVRATAGAMGQFPGFLHLFQGAGRRERVLLQLSAQQLQHVAGLRPFGRRSAAPRSVRRHDPYLYGPGDNVWERLSHGFELSGILSYYSPLPFNIVSGANTIQTTSGRPCPGLAGNSATCTNNVSLMIGRNAGNGFDFFNLNTRLSRTFALGERVRLQALGEIFNTLNDRNNMIPNNSFGTGVYPTNPSSTFGQPTAVGDPRAGQVALRINF